MHQAFCVVKTITNLYNILEIDILPDRLILIIETLFDPS